MSEPGENLAVNVNRCVLNQEVFDQRFLNEKNEEKKTLGESGVKLMKKSFNPAKFLNIFSILNVITSYNFKNCLVADIISGLTVGIMQIPQALAYGSLTSLNPVHGLYTSFYPSLTYVIFGSSRHLSVGTFALVSLMVYGSVSRVEGEFMIDKQLILDPSNETLMEGVMYVTENELNEFRIRVATGLCFWCGIIQLIFAFFRFGFVTKYLSKPMLRGFNSAAAFHVFATQMQHVFGIYIKSKPRRILKLVFRFVTIFENIFAINWISFAISCISVGILVFTKLYLNEKFKKQLKGTPIPVEIVILIGGTATSYFAQLNKKCDLAIVGYIESGLAKPSLPEFSMLTSVFTDAIIISVVAIASSISIGDMYARKHKYKLNSNKEILALGMANVSGSFFQCFTCGGALARSAVLESSGGKTQVVTVIASSIVFSVLLWISPLLESLPKACLGSIIIAALTGLFKQMSDVKYYWKLDKVDFSVWMVTFMATAFLDIDIGLVIGLLTVLFLNTYRNQNIHLLELGQVGDSEIFSNIKKYDARVFNKMKILRPTQSIFYINCDDFRKKLNKRCPVKKFEDSKSLYANCLENYGCKSNSDNENDVDIENSELNKQNNHIEIIILDLSSVTFIDEAGVNCLIKVLDEYNKEGVKVIFTNINDDVRSLIKKMRCDWNALLFLTVKDAVLYFAS